ncbi:type IVB secretion system protein IcmH/DotU [Vibrio marisflavi]|nr:type IVB secretion system protein IcmH/DotU [Vibrio marisflavi]
MTGGQLAQYDSLLFDNVENINKDQDYWFQLRGNNINIFIDAATPLLGATLRIRQLGECENVADLYYQAVEEIKAIEIELTEARHQRAEILAYRYILCSFIDEAVMSTSWGANSMWAECSLLTRFHNETWGGEKVYSILSRLESEPNKFKDLLAFIYLCMNLGFEGRYKVMTNGREEFENVLAGLHDTLQKVNEFEPEALSDPYANVSKTPHRMSKQLSPFTVFSGFAVTLAIVFSCFFVALHSKSADVLQQLNQLL